MPVSSAATAENPPKNANDEPKNAGPSFWSTDGKIMFQDLHRSALPDNWRQKRITLTPTNLRSQKINITSTGYGRTAKSLLQQQIHKNANDEPKKHFGSTDGIPSSSIFGIPSVLASRIPLVPCDCSLIPSTFPSFFAIEFFDGLFMLQSVRYLQTVHLTPSETPRMHRARH